MDAKDVKSELQALRILYELLKSDGDGVSNTASDILDGNARLVLKNLLDAATQRVLKAHAELIAAQLNDSFKEQPVPQQNIATASEVSEGFGTEHGSDQKIKQEQSIQNVGTSGPEYLKKRCRVCKKSTIKKLESINPQNQTEHSLWKSGQEPGSLTDIGGTYDFGDETTNEHKETDYLSKEASEAIKEIELCISALQLGADHLYLFDKRPFQHRNVVPGTNSVQAFNGMFHQTTQQFTRKRGQTWGSGMPNELREPIEERPVQKVNQDRGLKVKANIDKIESGKWKMSYDNLVNRQIIPHPQKLISGPSKMESPDKSLIAMKNKSSTGNIIFPPDKHSNKSGMKLISNGNVPDWRASGKTHPSKSKMVNLLNKNRRYESESTASSSSYSSNWSSSQQNSIYYDSDSKEYSFPRGTRRSSNSGASPLSSEIESNYGSSTSTSEDDEVYSSTSNGAPEQTSNTGSKSEEYSTDDQSIPSRIHKPANTIKFNRTKKQSGTWKRLKDRLAIIFHHHHHHHHHNEENNHHKGKSVLSRREAEAYGEKAVEKMRKSVVHGKKRQNHFHGLMETVLRHVRHSKKSKSVEKTVPLVKVRQGNKKASQKSQWWKLMQHHRRAKFPNKAHVKFGVGKMKPRLKALPTIK